MSRRFPQFLRLSLILLPGMSALSTHAAGPLAISDSVIQSNAVSSGNGFNSLSAADRKKLLAMPEGELPSNSTGLNLKDDRYCKDLRQQIKRAQHAGPTAGARQYRGSGLQLQYGADNNTVLQYDERSRLEASYQSECVR